MALYGSTDGYQAPPAKKTRQGNSKNTKLAASSRNGARKKYRGQGKYSGNPINKRYTAKYLSNSRQKCLPIGSDQKNMSPGDLKT